MRAALDKDGAFAFEHDFPVLVQTPVGEADNSGIRSIAFPGLEHFAEGVKRVAGGVLHRRAQSAPQPPRANGRLTRFLRSAVMGIVSYLNNPHDYRTARDV